MGLLDGLQTLQGAPPPRPATLSPTDSASATASDAMTQFSSGAQSLFGDFSAGLAGGVEGLGGGVKTSVNSFRRMMGDESADIDLEDPVEQMTLTEEMGTLFNLTWWQRLGLFAMVFGTGVLLIGISFTFLPVIVLVPHKFAAAFTMGNLLAIMSTWILVGPRAQLQAMFHPVRATAAAVYLSSLLVSLLAAFFGGKLRYILVLASIVAEIGARKLNNLYFHCPCFIIYTR